MAEAYPVSFRERVVAAYEAGEGSYAMLAARFIVGSATVKRWVAQRRRDGHLQPKPKAGGSPSLITGPTVDAMIAALRDPTAGELTAAYNRDRRGRRRVHVSSIKRALHRHDYVVKKNDAGRRKWIGQTSKSDGERS
jgi:transposase